MTGFEKLGLAHELILRIFSQGQASRGVSEIQNIDGNNPKMPDDVQSNQVRPSGKLTWLLKIAIEIVDSPIKNCDFQ